MTSESLANRSARQHPSLYGRQAIVPVTCIRCGSLLTTEASVARRIGPGCWRRVSAAIEVLRASGNPAAGRAADLLEAGTIRRTDIKGLFLVPSATEFARYWRCDNNGCTCPGGGGGRLCYHRAAIQILLI